MTNFEYLRKLAYHVACLDERDNETFETFNFETNRIRIEHDKNESSIYYVLTDKTTGEKIFRYTIGFDDDNVESEYIDQINPAVNLVGHALVEPEDFDDDWSDDIHLYTKYDY